MVLGWSKVETASRRFNWLACDRLRSAGGPGWLHGARQRVDGGPGPVGGMNWAPTGQVKNVAVLVQIRKSRLRPCIGRVRAISGRTHRRRAGSHRAAPNRLGWLPPPPGPMSLASGPRLRFAEASGSLLDDFVARLRRLLPAHDCPPAGPLQVRFEALRVFPGGHTTDSTPGKTDGRRKSIPFGKRNGVQRFQDGCGLARNRRRCGRSGPNQDSTSHWGPAIMIVVCFV